MSGASESCGSPGTKPSATPPKTSRTGTGSRSAGASASSAPSASSRPKSWSSSWAPKLTYRDYDSTGTRIPAAQPVCDDARMGRTVLIVDDHPSFRATAHALLEAEGFSVVGEAADGAEALAKAAELHPDLVLLDVPLAEAAGASAIIATSNHEPHKIATIALAVTAGVSFAAAGLHVLRRRPENRTGLYLAAVGYLWMFGALPEANNNVVYTAGIFLSNLAFIPFAALVLAFPTGRLVHRVDRVIVRATAWFVVIGPPLLLL